MKPGFLVGPGRHHIDGAVRVVLKPTPGSEEGAEAPAVVDVGQEDVEDGGVDAVEGVDVDVGRGDLTGHGIQAGERVT